jgi:hypothetical protein
MLLAGAALALVALPLMFEVIPNDLDRFRVILRAMRTMKPDIIVLGDSRAASGIDARQLSNEIAGHPLALNLSTHGTTLDHVLLLMQEVPESTRVVVLLVGRDRFVATSLNQVPFNALYMYGYRPNGWTLSGIADAFGVEASRQMARPRLAQVAASRWTVRQAADMMVYDAMRGQASRIRERDDLYFPMRYDQRLDPARFAAAVSILRRDVPNAPVSSAARKLLQAIALAASRKHQRLLLVFTPTDPVIFGSGKASQAVTSARSIPNMTVLDASTLLADAEFADPVHPTPAGARKLTSFVAKGVGDLR